MEINRERMGIEKKFFLLCSPIVEESGFHLYDLEYIKGSQTLRIFIQNPQTGSAVIEDCIKVDHALSPSFEETDWIPEDITLEVSSPGIYRHLVTIEHFKMSLGENLQIHLKTTLDDKQFAGASRKLRSEKKLRGKLVSVCEDNFVIEVEHHLLKIKYEQVKKVNLDPDLKSVTA